MQLYSMADLGRNTKAVVNSVTTDGSALITSNGTPKTLMINIAGSDIAELTALVRRIMLERAITTTQMESLKRKTDKLSLDEVNDLIADARKEKPC